MNERRTQIPLALLMILRASIIGPAILLFLSHGFLLRKWYGRTAKGREMLIDNVRRYSIFALRVMGIRVRVKSELHMSGKNHLIVCNHLSYLDMMVIASTTPATFVTSVDMRQTFFLGAMTEIGGSLFIERRNRERIQYDIEQIKNVLVEGFDVVLFPEGTSGDGSSVLPFKRSLLTAAAEAGCPILPMTIKYNSDDVCWYGKMAFLPHFAKVLSLQSVEASLTMHKSVGFSDSTQKHLIADQLHRTISTEYHGQGEQHGFSELR